MIKKSEAEHLTKVALSKMEKEIEDSSEALATGFTEAIKYTAEQGRSSVYIEDIVKLMKISWSTRLTNSSKWPYSLLAKRITSMAKEAGFKVNDFHQVEW